MEDLSVHFAKARLTVTDAFHQIYSRLEHLSPESLQHSVKHYFDALAGTNKEQLLLDLRLLNLTPATATLALVTVPTLLIASRFMTSGGSSCSSSDNAAKNKLKNKKKKQTKAQKANKEIQKILDFVEETYVPQIDSYIENYTDLSEEEQQYKYKYFEEMLLKELMKLDNVDVAGNDVLRENRKKVIRFVQEHQKRLDVFKKDN